MTKFSDFDLDDVVLQAVESAGYEQPTPIQIKAIPPALEGRDVIGIAQTGTGKTASYVLPMVTTLSRGRARARMPRSLVLAPTRELATQVAESISTYSSNSNLSMGLLIGGVAFGEQIALIDKGVDVLIATPGRLLDHFDRGRLLLSAVSILVIDEADRMLDMGFIPDIERIVGLPPFTRQTLFFAATMAPEIERIADEFLSNPVRVEVTRRATVSERIDQSAIVFKPTKKDREFKEKREILRHAIRQREKEISNGIVFCNRKSDVDLLLRSMKAHNLDSAAIHGDLDQSVRTSVLEGFRDGNVRFLIASDVAARGLDLPNVSHVINFDIPVNAEDYVHRIGRTGRAGRTGSSITILSESETKKLVEIEKLVGHEIPRLDPPRPTVESAEADASSDFSAGDLEVASRRHVRKRKTSAVSTRKNGRKSGKQDNMLQQNPKDHPIEPFQVVGMGKDVPAFLLRSFGKNTNSPR